MSALLDMEDDLATMHHMLRTAMQLFGDHMTSDDDNLSQDIAEIWCCVRIANERQERVKAKLGRSRRSDASGKSLSGRGNRWT